MKPSVLLLALIGAWCVLVSSRSVVAQNQVPRYRPSRPTVSPYMNLFREDRGPLSNYHTYVRPMLEQQSVNYRQQSATQQLQQHVQALQQQGQQYGPAEVSPTGIGATFMNRLHYYPGYRQSAPRR